MRVVRVVREICNSSVILVQILLQFIILFEFVNFFFSLFKLSFSHFKIILSTIFYLFFIHFFISVLVILVKFKLN